MKNSKNKLSIGIIGGGPGGSILASYLGKSDIEVTLFEKENFPRHHIGESLNPAVMYILDELGITVEGLGSANCAQKNKVVWTLPRKEFSYELFPKAIHVERSRFDDVLMSKALESGTKLIKAKVTDVDLQSSKPVISYTNNEGNFQKSFDFVVDASGRSALIANKLNILERMPLYNHIAVHSRFCDYEIPKSESDSTVLHYLTEKEGWSWQFPIGDNLFSVGVVIPRTSTSTVNNLEQFFWDSLSTRPDIVDRLKTAKCISEYKIDANYSYRVQGFTGKNYALIGDASGYIDPIFSAGIGIASHGAKYLAHDICRLHADGLAITGDALTTFNEKMSIGFHNWRGVIQSYYRLQVAITYFIVHSDHAALVKKLLNGELYDEKQDVLLTKIREIITSVENTPTHPWHPYLGKNIAK